MAEEDEVGQLVNDRDWNLSLAHVRVTRPALRYCRKPSPVLGHDSLVTRRAAQLQGCVFPVTERIVSGVYGNGQGNENATKESEYLSLYLFPPPAATTTYCLPVFFD